MNISFIIIFYALILLRVSIVALFGYDCGKQYLSTKKYSAVDVEPCPEINGWYEDPIPVELQLVRVPKKETFVATICDVKVTRIVQYCGELDSIVYGTPIILEKNKPFRMSKYNCERLVNNKEMNYEGYSWPVSDLEFTKDLVIRGSRDAETGSCTASEPFEKNNKHFKHHVMREVDILFT